MKGSDPVLAALLVLATIAFCRPASAAAWRTRIASHDALLALLLAVSAFPGSPVLERVLLPVVLLAEAGILTFAFRSWRFSPDPVAAPGPTGIAALLASGVAAALVLAATGWGSTGPVAARIGIPAAVTAAAAAGLLCARTDADRAGTAGLAANGLLLATAVLPAGGLVAVLPLLIVRPALLLVVVRPPSRRRADPPA